MKVVYETIDGKTFEKEEDAIKHEKILNSVKAFKIYANPDLCEGRHGANFQGYLLVHSERDQSMFAEHWCYKKYGNKIDFVQGVYGSNAIMFKWKFEPCDINIVKEEDMLDKIEENFVEKIWK